MLIKLKQRGFSLVELLVAIIIVAILISLALPSYQVWIQNQQIRVAAESILNGIQIARSEAVKNNGLSRFVLCGPINVNSGLPTTSWEVLIASAAAAAAPPLSQACPGTSNAAVGEVRVQERSGQEGSRFATAVATSVPTAFPLVTDGSTTVTFNSFGRVVANTFGAAVPGGPVSTIEVANPVTAAGGGGDRPLWITVGAGGNIRMCDPSPLLAATDSRRCL